MNVVNYWILFERSLTPAIRFLSGAVSVLVICFVMLSCSAMRNRELWVKSKPFKCISITEGHRDGHTVWFVQYERIDGIKVYEMCFEEPRVKVGEYTTAFLIR